MHGPLLNVHTTQARLLIDQSSCWANLGIKPVKDYIADFAAESRQKALEGDARRTREGERVMRLDRGEKNVFQHIAQERMQESAKGRIRSYSPDVKPELTFVPGKLEIDYLGYNFDRKG